MSASALAIGRTGELLAAAALQTLGYHAISVSNKKYDLLVDYNNKFIRVQVKACSAPRSRGSYEFKSAHGASAKKKYSSDDVDVFAFVALDLRRVFFVEASEVTTVTVRIKRQDYIDHTQEGRSWEEAIRAIT